MHDARWTRILLTIALLQVGLGGILAVTMSGDGSDGDGSVATDTPTTTSGGGSSTIPSTDPAFGTGDPGDSVSVTTQPPPVQDTRPHLPPSK